jgi:hypothetical protein
VIFRAAIGEKMSFLHNWKGGLGILAALLTRTTTVPPIFIHAVIFGHRKSNYMNSFTTRSLYEECESDHSKDVRNKECSTHIRKYGTHIILFDTNVLYVRGHMGDLDEDG